MPYLKQPLKLEVISMKLIIKLFKKSFAYIEDSKCDESGVLKKELESQLDGLPVHLYEIFVTKVTHAITEANTYIKYSKGLLEALDALLRPNMKLIDLRLERRYMLPDKVTTRCQLLLSNKFVGMNYLCDLILLTVCTDEILKTLARCCTSLKKLDISYSDQVTDDGLSYLCGLSDENESTGCKDIEWLTLNSLIQTTAKGVRIVVESLPKLKYLQNGVIGEVFRRKFDDIISLHSDNETKITRKHEEYGLTLFDQTYNLFTPSEKMMEYVTECCPHIRSIKVLTHDSALPLFKSWNKVENFTFVTHGECGEGLMSYLESLGSNLVKVQISDFFSLKAHHLTALGECCPNVKHMSIFGSYISKDKILVNKNYFTEMESFDLEIEYREGITATSLLFFISSCKYLRIFKLYCLVAFLNDSFFQSQILAKCPISNIEELYIQGPKVPLTLKTARRLLRSCPKLKKLPLSGWSVPKKIIKEFHEEMKSCNYDIIVM